MTDLVAKSSIERRLVEIVRPVIEGMGFDLVRVRLMGGGRRVLQIMAQRPDGSMGVDDCASISIEVSAALDVEDPIKEGYSLEVSSPGLDRPLTRLRDFDDWAGHLAKVETTEAVDGRRRFRGEIRGAEGDEVLIEVQEGGRDVVIGLKFDWLSDAKLVITDGTARGRPLPRGAAGEPGEIQSETIETALLTERTPPEET